MIRKLVKGYKNNPSDTVQQVAQEYGPHKKDEKKKELKKRRSCGGEEKEARREEKKEKANHDC
jgi:hypothetical protein